MKQLKQLSKVWDAILLLDDERTIWNNVKNHKRENSNEKSNQDS